ncbi:MAG: hypothetical protein QG549_392 [Patescibacteria group bacterium]|nr:hypothetical protein [Patescibacteria group bacterium]
MNTLTVFNGFSVSDADATRDFYSNIVGLEIEDEKMGLRYKLPSGSTTFMYVKPDHKPAEYTVLNFVVSDIVAAVDELIAKGVKFEMYDNLYTGATQDEKGILRSPDQQKYGPSIAWFKDPSGNILSVIEDKTA